MTSLLPKSLMRLSPFQMAHFIILGGQKREQARSSITELLFSLLCPARHLPEHLSSCSICLNVAKHSHEELLWIESESHRLKLSDVEGLAQHLSLSPLLPNTKRCAVIMDFESLTPSAAALLLKTLEELPPNAQVIAHSSSPRKILATLRSRGPLYRLPVTDELELIFDDEILAATEEILAERPNITLVSATWSQLARSKRCSLDDFFRGVEILLNKKYKDLLLGNASDNKGGETFKTLTLRRRKTISHLRILATRKNISLNLRSCAEQIALAGG